LSDTEDAAKLVAAVLAKARDEKTADAFRDTQLVNNGVVPATDHVNGSDVLRTIRIDTSAYDALIDDLRDKSEDSTDQVACGNLLLMAGRPADARMCFELALQLIVKNAKGNAEDSGQVHEAIRALDGIARTIRDEDDSPLAADAFVLTVRTRSTDQAMDQHSIAITMPAVIREAASDLSTSGIFYDALPPASFQSAEDPCAKAATDPSLAAWLKEWQQNKVEGAMLIDRRAELRNILTKTPLSCLTLIGIGRSMSFQSTDEWAESAIFATAALHAHTELANYAVGEKQSRPILDGLYSVKSTLWKMTDGGDHTFIDALYTLNCDLIRHIPSDDSGLQEARVHGFIGRAECLWAMGKTDDAVSAAESIDTSSLTAKERVGVAWIRGLALYSKGRYSDAIPELQSVIGDPSFAYSGEAHPLLIVSLAQSARNDEATVQIDEWIRRDHPNTKQVASVMAQMGIAPLVLSR
jgi:tetratricopeptide (TPR) repeat protein